MPDSEEYKKAFATRCGMIDKNLLNVLAGLQSRPEIRKNFVVMLARLQHADFVVLMQSPISWEKFMQETLISLIEA